MKKAKEGGRCQVMGSDCETQKNKISQLCTWYLEHNPEPCWTNVCSLILLLYLSCKFLEFWLSVNGSSSSTNLIVSWHLPLGTSSLFVMTLPLVSQIRSRYINWLHTEEISVFIHTNTLLLLILKDRYVLRVQLNY